MSQLINYGGVCRAAPGFATGSANYGGVCRAAPGFATRSANNIQHLIWLPKAKLNSKNKIYPKIKWPLKSKMAAISKSPPNVQNGWQNPKGVPTY